jgi:hypothetical protein
VERVAAAMRSASVASRTAAEVILTTDHPTVALHALSARSIALAAAQHQSCTLQVQLGDDLLQQSTGLSMWFYSSCCRPCL